MPTDDDQTFDSRAPYIIICNGRMEVLATEADDGPGKLVAASNAATDLVKYFDLKGAKLQLGDTKLISDLQHYMMDNMHTMSIEDVDGHVRQMFVMLDAMEDKYQK